MRDGRVLVCGLVAGDGADVTALVINVDLAGGRVGKKVPFVGRGRIGVGRSIDDRRRGRSWWRRRRAGCERERQQQGDYLCAFAHGAVMIRYFRGMANTSRKWWMVFSRPGRSAVCGCQPPRIFFASSMFGLRRMGSS